MTEPHDEAPVIRLSISPEPTDEEAAAIAAVVIALSASGRGEAMTPGPPVDRWAEAGRHEALRGSLWPVEDTATMGR